jgi:hypothetical protein
MIESYLEIFHLELQWLGLRNDIKNVSYGSYVFIISSFTLLRGQSEGFLLAENMQQADKE